MVNYSSIILSWVTVIWLSCPFAIIEEWHIQPTAFVKFAKNPRLIICRISMVILFLRTSISWEPTRPSTWKSMLSTPFTAIIVRFIRWHSALVLFIPFFSLIGALIGASLNFLFFHEAARQVNTDDYHGEDNAENSDHWPRSFSRLRDESGADGLAVFLFFKQFF